MWLIALILLAVVLWLIIAPYLLKYDNLVSFTGGLGSGKTFMSVKTALVLYRRQRLKVRIYNFFHPNDKQPLPKLYSNIPVKISPKQWAEKLKPEHLLLQERVELRSVCLLDEVDGFANQFQFSNPCIVDTRGNGNGNFDEFCRFYRHYTKGGYLIFNTQATANENLAIRRRQNTCITLFKFRKIGLPFCKPLLYWVKARNKTLSDDVTTIEENNTEDNMRNIIGFFPLWKTYDTYCYSDRYLTVPEGEKNPHKRYKINKYIKSPYGNQPKYTNDNEEW